MSGKPTKLTGRFTLKPDELNYSTYYNDYQDLVAEIGPVPHDGALPIYRMLVMKMKVDEKYTLNIDFNHLSLFDGFNENFDLTSPLILNYQV